MKKIGSLLEKKETRKRGINRWDKDLSRGKQWKKRGRRDGRKRER